MGLVERGVRDVLASIGRGEIVPVYLLHGEEDFLVERASRAVVEALRAATGAEVESLDARETSLAALVDRALEVSLFTSRRIVVVRQSQHLSTGTKAEVASLESFARARGPEGNVLLFSAGQAMDRRGRVYKTLAAMGAEVVFSSPKGRALAEWLQAEAERRGLKVGKLAEDALLARTGPSLRVIDRELDKLALWVSPRADVTPEDIQAVVPRSREDVIFDLTGALGERDVGAGLRYLRELRFRGATPIMILSMLGREIRFLLQAKFLGGAVESAGWNERLTFDRFVRDVWPRVKETAGTPPGDSRFHLLGANPYAAFLVLRRARQFTRGELVRGLGLVGRTDLVLKSTTQSADALLERLVIELTLREGRPCAGTT